MILEFVFDFNMLLFYQKKRKNASKMKVLFQLQGIKWIKSMYGHKLNVIRLGQKNYLDRIEKALSDGSTILIENIGESVDPVLDSLLGRNLIKKGRQVTISGFSPKDLSNLSEVRLSRLER